MKAPVIYDTFFGNTEKMAHAISESLGAESSAIRVADARHGQLNGLGLLLVGSP